MRKLSVASSLIVLLALPVATFALEERPAEAMSWNVDAAHTEINFSVKHFFTPVTGSFRDFEVSFQFDKNNPENSRIEAKIAVASVDTGNERRDNHLRSGDWFETDKYPYMSFVSKSVRKVGDGKFVARGELTIKGTTREIELPVSLLGVQMIPAQMAEMVGGIKEAASFQATTTVSRNDYGVGVGSWAATMVVGSDVTIEILMEANHK